MTNFVIPSSSVIRHLPLIYLDYNATTPLAPEVFDAMRPYLERHFGNPSSIHAAGREARAAIDDSRDRLAALVMGKAVARWFGWKQYA